MLMFAALAIVDRLMSYLALQLTTRAFNLRWSNPDMAVSLSRLLPAEFVYHGHVLAMPPFHRTCVGRWCCCECYVCGYAMYVTSTQIALCRFCYGIDKGGGASTANNHCVLLLKESSMNLRKRIVWLPTSWVGLWILFAGATYCAKEMPKIPGQEYGMSQAVALCATRRYCPTNV